MVMADMKVTITPELVERAVQRDSRHCMIAEAIKEQNPHFKFILVDLATIRWTNPRTGKRYLCLTPPPAATALIAFDQGGAIDPFAFTLKPIQTTPTRKSGKPRGGKKLDPRQMTISGGVPLPTGHLGGGSDVKRQRRRDGATPPDGASNVVRSTSRYREYGRRLLKG
jgi:hypothetical protein